MTALTHAQLDRLLESHRRGAMLFGSDEHDSFIEDAINWMPRLIEAARSVAKGEVLLEVHIPGYVPRGTLNSREHWAKRSRRVANEHAIVALVLHSSWKGKARPSLPLSVTMTRANPRMLDGDNCVGSLKGTRDSVAKWLGIDDGDSRVSWNYEQRKCKRAGAGTIIRIERRHA